MAACGEEGTDLDAIGVLDGTIIDMPVTPEDGSPPPAEYLYVMIEDLSTLSGAKDGADIDAVELQKGGVSSWADAVESCTLPDGNACENSDSATGASDAFCTDPTKCYSNLEDPDDPATIPPYVALGGDDGTNKGTLILKMASKIENDDMLIVYELGNCEVTPVCDTGTPVNASPESIKVSVGTSASGPWVSVLDASDTANHPKVEITVAGLQ